ncbi:MAG: hemerythrin domain-containing protein [Pseudomonadota bacterium]
MADLEQLYEEHRMIRQLGDRLVELARQETPPPRQQIADARYALAALILRHLAHEERIVRAPLAASNSEAARALAERYSAELVELRMLGAAHNREWSPVAIEADWIGYRKALRVRIARLDARIDWEEREIFPAVRALWTRAA